MNFMSVRDLGTGEVVLVFRTESELEATITLGDGFDYKIKKITEAQFETLKDVLGVEETSGPMPDIVELVRMTHDIYSNKKSRTNKS